MRKQEDFELNPFSRTKINSDKNKIFNDNQFPKCLDCDEILILNWLNENEKILVCSNNLVKRLLIKFFLY